MTRLECDYYFEDRKWKRDIHRATCSIEGTPIKSKNAHKIIFTDIPHQLTVCGNTCLTYPNLTNSVILVKESKHEVKGVVGEDQEIKIPVTSEGEIARGKIILDLAPPADCRDAKVPLKSFPIPSYRTFWMLLPSSARRFFPTPSAVEPIAKVTYDVKYKTPALKCSVLPPPSD